MAFTRKERMDVFITKYIIQKEMIKKLPINIDPHVTTECYNFYRLAITLTLEENTGWFFERFFNLYMYEDYSLSYYDWGGHDYLSLYDEVLDIYSFKPQHNLFTEVKEPIDNDEYLLVYCDQYYIKGTKGYGKYSYLHETLVVGYDDCDKGVFCLNLNLNEAKWSIDKVSYDEFEKAVRTAFDIIKKKPDDYTWITQYNLPLSKVRLRQPIFTGNVRIPRLLECVNYYLEGKVVKSDFELPHLLSMPNVYRKGISIYKGYYKDLYYDLKNQKVILSDNLSIIYGLKKVVEAKELMVKRLQLKVFESHPHLVEKSQELVMNLSLAFKLMVKYSFSENNEYLERAMTYIKISEQIDIDLMSEFKKVLITMVKDDFSKIELY